jgi:hypothetical protein
VHRIAVTQIRQDCPAGPTRFPATARLGSSPGGGWAAWALPAPVPCKPRYGQVSDPACKRPSSPRVRSEPNSGPSPLGTRLPDERAYGLRQCWVGSITCRHTEHGAAPVYGQPFCHCDASVRQSPCVTTALVTTDG